MNTRIFIAAGAALLLLNLVIFLAKQLRSPLRAVKGPFLARLSSAWYAWKIWQGSFQAVNLELHRKHGKTRTSGTNEPGRCLCLNFVLAVHW